MNEKERRFTELDQENNILRDKIEQLKHKEKQTNIDKEMFREELIEKLIETNDKAKSLKEE